MTSPERFSRRIASIGDGILRESDQMVRATALAVDQAVVLATPVDKGRARSNWLVELDAPARTTIEAYSPGQKGSTSEANTAAALAQGRATVAAYDGNRNKSIAISNNLSYIDALNNGKSQQAPAGFVDKAVQVALKEVRRARLLR